MNANYVFRIRFRLDYGGELQLDPAEFETVVRQPAAEPGTDGWLFFRDVLWRGDVTDEQHVRELFSRTLSVTVVAVEFRALETDAAYLDALKHEISANLDAFKAETVSEVLNKYLASRLEVR